jgi:hypothetical protein
MTYTPKHFLDKVGAVIKILKINQIFAMSTQHLFTYNMHPTHNCNVLVKAIWSNI